MVWAPTSNAAPASQGYAILQAGTCVTSWWPPLQQHHRRGLAWGGGHLFAADPRDTVSARPSQTLQAHICWGFGASPLGCQAKQTPSQAPDPRALPSTCSSPAFPPPELTALPFSRSDHKPWHHGRPFPSSHAPASLRSTGSPRGACSAPLLPPPAGTVAGLIPKQLGSMPAALLLTPLALRCPQSPVLSPVPRPPSPAAPLPSLLASVPSLSWECANLPWASQGISHSTCTLLHVYSNVTSQGACPDPLWIMAP